MRWAFCFVLIACSSKSAPPSPQPEPARPIAGDAGVPIARPTPGYEPSGMHLDDDTGARVAQASLTPHAAHPIDVTLRSTPTGARAIVDGTFVGTTPAFWSGEADGHEHEFTFVLEGHALARYRFVPVASGVVHARLEPIADEADAGVPELTPPAVVPKPAPIAPPPTVVSPPDARPAIDAHDPFLPF
jgi:hypothetical protein